MFKQISGSIHEDTSTDGPFVSTVGLSLMLSILHANAISQDRQTLLVKRPDTFRESAQGTVMGGPLLGLLEAPVESETSCRKPAADKG